MAPPRPKTNIHIYVVINMKTEKKKKLPVRQQQYFHAWMGPS